jgi:hypothetical protein
MRPGDIDSARKPIGGRRIVEKPARVANQLFDGHSRTQTHPARFNQNLKLEHAGGRRVERRVLLELARPAVTLMQPDQSVGVEQDHFRGRRRRNIRPSAPKSHVHCPPAMASSTYSIILRAGARRRPSSGRMTKRTPRRSITAGCPCSAASSKSENLARASATVYRFICPLYIIGSRGRRRYDSFVVHTGGGWMFTSGVGPGSGRPEPSSRLIARTVMS